MHMLVAILLSALALQQDPTMFGRRCPPEGRNSDGSEPSESRKELYRLKGRWEMPDDFDTLEIGAILRRSKDDSKRWLKYQHVTVKAYLARVKDAPPESCNCHGEGPKNVDTRLYLTAGPKSEFYMVAEVTPRIKEIVARQGEDYSTQALGESMVGEWVWVSGYILFDTIHQHETANTGGPEDYRKAWRTSWEIHPVTKLELVQDSD